MTKKKPHSNSESLASLATRKTTYEFSEKTVPAKLLQTILKAGQWAPSYRNEQPWRFILVQNKKLVEQLVSLAHYGAFHSEPNVLIALVFVPASPRLYSGKENQLFATKQDLLSIGMAGFAMVLQAETLGIQSCFLSPEQEKTRQILNLEKEETVPLLVGLGFEKKGAFQAKRERKPFNQIVSEMP